MQHHNIVIRRSGADKNELVPDPPNPRKVKKGDTIEFTSPEGPLTVTFDDGSPFEGKGLSVGPKDKLMKPVKTGRFKYSCKVEIADGPPLEYRSGGELDVGI